MVDKQKAIETAISQIEKQFGKGSIMKLGSTATLNVEAISTGSISLDMALGIGGVPPRENCGDLRTGKFW